MTIDFVPLKDYADYYYHIIMVVTLITFFHTQVLTVKDQKTKDYLKIAGGILLLFVLLYIGLRPVSSQFTDMVTYNAQFQRYREGGLIIGNNDLLFHKFTQISAQYVSNTTYFFMCAFIYVFPLYLVSKKWFKEYWFYGFLLFVGSFSFWSYGVNGIRNGMAGSLVLLGFSREKRVFQALWLLIAVNIHRAVLLPVVGFLITQFYNKPQAFYILWFLCIPLSLAGGDFFQNIFAGYMEDDRASYLSEGAVEADKFKNVGFRWDFLFYSAFGVIAGWYYIFKRKLNDKFYIQLFNTYLFANAFWILVIRANFSNRFAYLSWFMMAVIIAYPWAKYEFIQKQHKKFGYVMMGYVGFTYLMYAVYYGNV